MRSWRPRFQSLHVVTISAFSPPHLSAPICAIKGTRCTLSLRSCDSLWEEARQLCSAEFKPIYANWSERDWPKVPGGSFQVKDHLKLWVHSKDLEGIPRTTRKGQSVGWNRRIQSWFERVNWGKPCLPSTLLVLVPISAPSLGGSRLTGPPASGDRGCLAHGSHNSAPQLVIGLDLNTGLNPDQWEEVTKAQLGEDSLLHGTRPPGEPAFLEGCVNA